MALKSYRLSFKNKGKGKKKGVSNIVRTGIGATIGVAFISTLANIIK